MKLEHLNEFWLYPVAYFKSIIDPQWHRGSFTCDYYALVFLKKGALTIRQNKFEILVQPHEGILINACQEYSQIYEPGSEVVSIKFFAMWKNERPAFHGTFPYHFSKQESKKLCQLSESILDYFPPEFDRSCGWSLDQPLEIQPYFKALSLTYEILTQMSEILSKNGFVIGIPEAKDPRVEKVVNDMRQNFYSKKPQDEYYASMVRMEKHAFCKVFAKETELSPIQYYNLLRLGYAKKELVLDMNSIKKIQHTLGFPSASSFTLWFQRQVGCNPSSYINLYRGKSLAK